MRIWTKKSNFSDIFSSIDPELNDFCSNNSFFLYFTFFSRLRNDRACMFKQNIQSKKRENEEEKCKKVTNKKPVRKLSNNDDKRAFIAIIFTNFAG